MTAAKSFCHACGAHTIPGALFCEACGAKLNLQPPAVENTDIKALHSAAGKVSADFREEAELRKNVPHPQQTAATVRGRILRDTNNGMGLLSVSGRQVPFSLETNWLGDTAPTVQMNVDVVLDSAGNAVTVVPVSDKDIAQEKLKALSGELSSKFQDQLPLAKTYANAIGTPVLVATALLFISWVWLSLVSVRVNAGLTQSATMFDALSVVNMGANLESFGRGSSGSSGIFGFVCVLAMLAPLAPAFIKRRYINLCYFAPLIFFVAFGITAFVKLRSYANVARESMGVFGGSAQMNNMMNAMMDQILAAASIGLGAYLSGAVALYLAAHGGIKFLANR